MTPYDLIAELLNYPAMVIFLYVLGILLVIAIVTFIIVFIRSFVTGKPFPIWSKSNHVDSDKSRTPVPLKQLPKNQKQLEKVLNQVNESALSRENDEYRKQYDTLISLLSDAHIYNNLILNKLTHANIEPYEAWLMAEKVNSEIYKNATSQMQFAIHVISEITAHTEKTSVRRASIALISQDGFLHMVISNVHPPGQYPEKIFKVGDTTDCGIAGLVAYTRKPKRVGNLAKERYHKKFATTPKYSSLLAVPIKIDDRVLGTFSIDSTTKHAFVDIDEKRVELFTHSIATTIFALMIAHSVLGN